MKGAQASGSQTGKEQGGQKGREDSSRTSEKSDKQGGRKKSGGETVDGFHELYVTALKDLYSAETQLLEALPKMAKAASSPELTKAFKGHLEVTKGQVQRLETIFQELGEEPGGHECKAMRGLIEEADEIIEEVKSGPLLDAAMITAAQKVEHYEISGYGSARTFAQQLGEDYAVELLQATLDEESEADELLSEIALSTINLEAAAV